MFEGVLSGAMKLESQNNRHQKTSARPARDGFDVIWNILESHVGCRCQHLMDELRVHEFFRRLGDEQLVHQVSQFVEFHVVEKRGQLCHGSGIWTGRPLTTGWRRQFYMCPLTGCLARIPAGKAGWSVPRGVNVAIPLCN